MPSGWVGTTTARSFAIKQDPAPGLLGKPSSMQGRGCTGRSRSRTDGQLASELAATTTHSHQPHKEQRRFPDDSLKKPISLGV